MPWKTFDHQIEVARQRLEALTQRATQSPEDQQPMLNDTLEELSATMEELHMAAEDLSTTHEAVEAWRRRYHELSDFLTDGYLQTNLEGTIDEANRAAAGLLRVRRDLLPGVPMSSFIDERVVKGIIAQAAKALGEGMESSQIQQIEIQPRDGRAFAALITVGCIRDEQGHLAGLCWLFQDVTARKRIEDELGRVRGDLEEKLRQREAELAKTSQALKASEELLRQADQRRDKFLSLLGHELRNPLAPILNSLHVIQLRDGATEFQKRFLRIIDRQTRRLARLVDDLLDVSRITRGKIELKKEIVSLATVVNAAVNDSRSAIESRQHELSVDLPSSQVSIEADPARLAQVIINLLDNAAKFTEPGGHIELSAEYDDRQGEVVLRVRDTGIGIAPEVLPQIFEPFSKSESNMDRSYGGLGLGLSLIQGLVRLHGGRVEAFSDGLGKGSEFVVHLPVSASKAKQEIPTQSESLPPREKVLRVLIVEDSQDTASTLGVILKMWGHEIRIAYNGHTGINYAKQFLPDVVLLDIGLPGMDGYEVAKALRRQVDLSSLIIIAVTGFGQEEDEERSREAGINHHYTKPIDLPSLRKLLIQLAETTAGKGK